MTKEKAKEKEKEKVMTKEKEKAKREKETKRKERLIPRKGNQIRAKVKAEERKASRQRVSHPKISGMQTHGVHGNHQVGQAAIPREIGERNLATKVTQL